jgi:predicted outer membrane repeat protein
MPSAGAVFMNFGGKIAFQGPLHMEHNTAGVSGGAIGQADTPVRLSWFHKATFIGNRALKGNGGAMSLGWGVTVSTPLTMHGNSAGSSGGAVAVGLGAVFSLLGDAATTPLNATITGNSATLDGGAIAGLDFQAGRIEVQDAQLLLSNNTAGRNGGGLWLSAVDISPFVTEGALLVKGRGGMCVKGNKATGHGGGIFLSGTAAAKLQGAAADAQLTMANNAPDAISIEQTASISCTSSNVTLAAGEYNVTGPACACQPANGGTSSCGCQAGK